jgi:hypothetical protein
MLIMVLLVLNIGFLQNLLDLLADVLNPINELCDHYDHIMIIEIICLGGGKRKFKINGTQGLESQTHLKWDMVGGAMESQVVTALNIGDTLIPCTCMLRIVHVQDVHNHLIDDLYLAIFLGVESVDTERGVNKYQVQFKTYFNLCLNHSTIFNEK